MRLSEADIKATQTIIQDARRSIVNAIMADINTYFRDIGLVPDSDTLRKIEDALTERYISL